MKFYVDTSVINGLFAEDAPWIKEATKDFFLATEKNRDAIIISDLVIVEIERTTNFIKRKQLLSTVKDYDFKIIKTTKDAEELAEVYIKNNIIPHKYLPDALHIAIATLNKIPILVSWNFKHIVRHKTRVEVNLINRKYKHIEIDMFLPRRCFNHYAE